VRKILVFTGAGISSPLGLPTTIDFLNEINHGAQPITKLAMNYLTEKHNRGHDIEWILSMLESFNKETTFVEYALSRFSEEPAEKALGEKAARKVAGMKPQAASEITRIKSVIIDKLNQFKSDAAFSLYINLVKQLKELFGESSISIFTTNYDMTFEESVVQYEPQWEKEGITHIEYGFTNHGRGARPLAYSQEQDFSWDKNAIEYMKIHGSIDWHKGRDGLTIRSGAHFVPRNPDSMLMLYPGFKGVPQEEPFKSLHDRLGRRLKEADIIVVIGFAFRDPYINGMFETALRSRQDARVLYFDPAKEGEYPADSHSPRFMSSYKNFVHIPQRIEVGKNPLGALKLER
jgi:hypothetical protein